jgi:Skp family chaperone for outer membrane proteins
MTKALMDESQKEDEEVAKELADEQAELVEVVEQAIGRKINKPDLSYLISNNEEIVVDKDGDIFDEIVERLSSLEPESEEEEASIPVLAKEAIQAVQLPQKWEA